MLPGFSEEVSSHCFEEVSSQWMEYTTKRYSFVWYHTAHEEGGCGQALVGDGTLLTSPAIVNGVVV